MSLFKKLFGKRDPNPYQENLTPEFAEVLDLSRFCLNQLTERNKDWWGFGDHKNYEMTQGDGMLRFFFENGTTVECSFQAIGSFSMVDNTWAWAWDNPSVNEDLKADAKKLYEYGRDHEFGRLTTAQWPADMNWAWSMTAFATMYCEASGAYCAKSGPMHLFLSFRDVKVIPPASV